jgi:hypothetical protein
MLAKSFRLVAPRLIPRPSRCKQALCLAALVLGIGSVAGCGGSSAPKAQSQVVTGAGYRFEAPAGWKVTRSPQRVSVEQDSELLQVAAFKLAKPYTAKLFARVATELSLRMATVARETSGKVVSSRTVSPAGIKSHAYEVQVGDHVDEYTFVLAGRREFQLLCRRNASGGVGICKQLVASFKVR